MSRIYIAAPLSVAAYACEVAAHLSAAGDVITSRWHGLVASSGAVDPHDEDQRRRILIDNIDDMTAADVLVALTHRGQGKATYGEIAWAMAWARPVVWVHGPAGEGRSIWDAFFLVRRVEEAVEADALTVANAVVEAMGRGVG